MTSYEDRVRRTTAQLQGGNLRAMSDAIAARRMAWLDDALAHTPAGTRYTPRDAYEMLLLWHMGLDPAELPVVSETERKIVWLSMNACTLLGACTALGRDTRDVCRPVNEKATQAFVSRLDPELRFHRSYEEIRPHAPHCREWIVRVDFEAYMRIALAEARISRSEGNKGYGAVVVYDHEIIGQAHDTAATAGDPSLHAEVNAIRQAARVRGTPDLCGALLFSTCEPCPMCAALACWANLTTIVYGASIEETARMGRTRIQIGVREIVDRSPSQIEVIPGVLREACCALYA